MGGVGSVVRRPTGGAPPPMIPNPVEWLHFGDNKAPGQQEKSKVER
ncbi:MAG: hypothetical protein F6K41_27485 [Symploca sp. SIO3E6]|nr:hypothetical protein [Caldora sp. SIO3E6]